MQRRQVEDALASDSGASRVQAEIWLAGCLEPSPTKTSGAPSAGGESGILAGRPLKLTPAQEDQARSTLSAAAEGSRS